MFDVFDVFAVFDALTVFCVLAEEAFVVFADWVGELPSVTKFARIYPVFPL